MAGFRPQGRPGILPLNQRGGGIHGGRCGSNKQRTRNAEPGALCLDRTGEFFIAYENLKLVAAEVTGRTSRNGQSIRFLVARGPFFPKLSRPQIGNCVGRISTNWDRSSTAEWCTQTPGRDLHARLAKRTQRRCEPVTSTLSLLNFGLDDSHLRIHSPAPSTPGWIRGLGAAESLKNAFEMHLSCPVPGGMVQI